MGASGQHWGHRPFDNTHGLAANRVASEGWGAKQSTFSLKKPNSPVQPSCIPSRSQRPVKAQVDAHVGLVPSPGWETMCSQPRGAPTGPPSCNDHTLLLRGVNELCRATMGKGGLQ